MRDALAADFAACKFIDEVRLLHDVRLPEPRIAKQKLQPVFSAEDEVRAFQGLAAEADRTVVIAPEFGGCLELRAAWATDLGATLLSPDVTFVHLTANKQHTAEFLQRAGVSVPRGITWQTAAVPTIDPSIFPAVLKPLDGAGSTSVQLVENQELLLSVDLTTEPAWRLERFQPGVAASVAYLNGPAGHHILSPCLQRLSDNGSFQYQGGSTPLPSHLANRARNLAEQVVGAMPATTGYVGIDIVLGPADNGANDVVIEVNPRLTTSYLGLRQACEQNLAEVMWRLSQGEFPRLSFRNEIIHFSPSPANDAA